MQADSSELLARIARERDSEAWALLVERFSGDMYQAARAIVGPAQAEDVVQDALIHAVRSAHTFSCRGADPEVDVWRWLRRIAVNCALKWHRSETRRLHREREWTVMDERRSPEAELKEADEPDHRRQELFQALRAVDEKTRQPIVLRFLLDCSDEDLARELGCSPGAARVRLHRAMNRLRKRLGALGLLLGLPALTQAMSGVAAEWHPVRQQAIATWKRLPAAGTQPVVPSHEVFAPRAVAPLPAGIVAVTLSVAWLLAQLWSTAAPAMATAGPVASWDFEGIADGIARDRSGRGHDGRCFGTTPTTGVLGQGLAFDGTAHIRVSDDRDLAIDGPLTLVAWVKPATLERAELKILSRGWSSTHGYDLGIGYHDRLLGRAGGAGDPTRGVVMDGGLRVGSWQMVALSYDGRQARLYLDGALLASRIATGPSGVVDTELCIGKPADREALHFVGSLDEISIYDRALAAAELAAIYDAVRLRSLCRLPPRRAATPAAMQQVAVLPAAAAEPLSIPGLLFHHPLDGSGACQGWRSPGDAGRPVADRFGRPAHALAFDGIEDLLVGHLDDDLPTGNGPRTLCCWFRSDQARQLTGLLAGWGTLEPRRGFAVAVGPLHHDGLPVTWRVNTMGDANDWRTGVPPAPCFDGTWHHLAVTWDGRRMVFWIDGDERAAAERPPCDTAAGPLFLGGLPGQGWYARTDLDDLLVFGRVLDDAEIRAVADDACRLIRIAALMGKDQE